MQVEPVHSHHPEPSSQPTSESALQLRNYDEEGLSEVTVSFEDADGDTVYEETHVVLPQTTLSIDLPLAPGTYRGSVRMGTKSVTSEFCRVGDGPTEFVAVEVGHGVMTTVSPASRVP
jgi:hypothetical protein